jgi:5-hydroxyisourate hydrolase
MASGLKRISTHILDLTRGKPAPDVAVRLERQESSGSWRVLASARTDQDGRCGQLLPETEPLAPGFYRLAFDTANYFIAQKTETLYPSVEITFRAREGESQFHIPLLLSPNGYTTYRGS